VSVAETRLLKRLSEENRRLMRLVADLWLDSAVLKDVSEAGEARGAALVVHYLGEEWAMSERHACGLVILASVR
jgi:hypothetical protein